MTLENEENKLKTLLLILNESDLLDEANIKNLFSCFPGVEKEGVENLIVYVDFLKTINAESKKALVHIFKERIHGFALEFPSFSVDIIEDYETPSTVTPSTVIPSTVALPEAVQTKSPGMSVCFVFGLGGRDELKQILSDFITRCRNEDFQTQTSEMTSDYISDSLKLPFEPDLIISHAKHTLTDFMIWQTVYSEYYFFEKDVGKVTDSDFRKAFDSFYKRDRRYGA
ncbi:undecaprenyl diphosphate synthase family protein [Methanimicrococcus blatticola]|uniref:Undecaprenyl diphosphate synthase n=1 Tax=Methanimicrococcus blatticola TaxID=91560 RepID=A0A484F2D1_9EURY|nr:undecaprenyl diphosphate synthase family protein [Methanimicrococcus blatticola]MBZ3936406.1 undecaprenyl diphosphate synthase family protein [Methanimicrococcus blatticola]MCC2509568.1 undecaprenyl diphosphate synthase family protein [Methanimicrococcus blatticola]TDQ67617.1 undecaprenyl diphosphate synthase [Methanimicrococcus blatticola]